MQAHLALLCFTLIALHRYVFHKLKARASTSKKIESCYYNTRSVYKPTASLRCAWETETVPYSVMALRPSPGMYVVQEDRKIHVTPRVNGRKPDGLSYEVAKLGHK